MAINLNSPQPDNYVVGKGRVFMKLATDPDWVRVGNVTEFEITPTLEELEHFDSQAGTKSVDKSIVVSKKAELRMIMEEWTPRNLALMLMGPAVIVGNHASIDIFSENVTRCGIKYEGTNDVGPKWSFVLPAVDFKPSSSINPISEEWAPLEITGGIARENDTFGTAEADFVDVIPANTLLPAIVTDGSPAVGETLTAFPGLWSGSTATYAYQWKNATVAIPGATAKTYVPVAGDSGDSITVTVTATNGAGSANATSAAVVIA